MAATPISAETFLSAMPLFRELSPAQRHRIAESTRQLRVARGDVLFHRGDPCNGMHLVVHGQIKLSFVSSGGVEKVIEFLGAGQSFGEAVMFLDVPHVVSAQALTDSLLLWIPKEAVHERIEHDPGFARGMLAGLARRLHQLVADVEAFSTRSGTERVIGFMLRDCASVKDGEEEGAVDIVLPVAKGVIASRLNLTQEHFSRILHELSAAGLIEVKGRQIHVPDPRKLRDYAP
ncbi:MAG: Crp/Fnr family transcriptional regulator [Gemmatimonadota bacterium]